MIYFDNAASAPVLECARKAAEPFLWECCGNPSSIHSEGRRAALALIEAREKCAAAVGAEPDEIVFTSGRHRIRQHGGTAGGGARGFRREAPRCRLRDRAPGGAEYVRGS